MSAIAIISFSIFLIALLSLIRKEADLFSPARLFTLVWSFAIGLTELKLSRLQFNWNGYSWFILLLCISSVFLGMFIVYVLNINNNLKTVATIRDSVAKIKINSDVFFKLIVVMFSAYLISYIAIYLIVGFIPLFTATPNIARLKWSVFGFGLIIHLAPAAIYLIFVFYLLVKAELGKKSILSVLLLVTLLSFLLLLQRFGLVISIILTLIYAYYGTFKFRPRNLIVVFVLVAIFMYGISTLRVSSFFVEFFYYTSKMKFSHDYAFLSEPYMYVAMNLENFANAVNKLERFTYGYFTFDFILALS
ncbi:MAG: O-antigen polymerase, partial [Ignavibacteria bacterium]|nr:O-antigen polymerase [Ignavibacteria bacterium]